MKITKLIGAGALVAAVTIAMGASPAQAKDCHHRNINERQHFQNRRIERGERSGQLTDREEDRLERREWGIARQERRDRRDGGKFTLAERFRIQRELNQTSRSIYRQKHDGQHR